MLQVQQLHCLRDSKALFSDLTFDLEPGCWIHITGSNGSGKSSLLKAITGLLPFFSGSISWKGKKVQFPDREFARNFVYLGHKIAIQSRLTPLENLRWWLKLRAPSTQYHTVSLADLLKRWGIDTVTHLSCEQLSLGQCQRVALSRLALESAPLWILDEPTTALDEAGLKLFESMLQNHLHSGGMAIIASHVAFQGIAGQRIELGTELC